MKGLTFRAATEADAPYVMETWLTSFRNQHAAGPLPIDVYYDAYRAAIPSLLGRKASRLIIASVDGAEKGNDIAGWIAYEAREKPVVHFVYTKHAFRRYGVCRDLIAEAGVTKGAPWVYTFKTGAWIKLMADSSLRHGARWNPEHAQREPERQAA